MKLYFFYFAVLLNCIGLDITFERYIQSSIIKFIILGLFFIPVLINRNLKIANKSYRSIFKLIILYIALNILIGLLYENDRFTNIFINSTFSFTLPLFIFYYYINLNITKFITLFKIMPIILLLIGVLFDLF